MAIFHSDSDDALHAIIPGLTHVEAPAPPSAPRAGEVQRVKTTTFVLIDWPRHELSPGLLLRLAVLPRSQGEGHDVVLIDRFRDLRPDLRRKSRKLRTLDRSSPSPLLAVARLSLATTGSPSLARELLLQLRDLSLSSALIVSLAFLCSSTRYHLGTTSSCCCVVALLLVVAPMVGVCFTLARLPDVMNLLDRSPIDPEFCL